jgi:hypothetical protein
MLCSYVFSTVFIVMPDMFDFKNIRNFCSRDRACLPALFHLLVGPGNIEDVFGMVAGYPDTTP